MEKRNKLFIVTDEKYLTDVPSDATLVLTTFWLENQARKADISFISFAPFVPQGEVLGELLARTETISREWYRLPEAESLVYGGIRIGEVLEPMFDFYLGRLLYYIHAFEALLSVHTEVEELILPGNVQEVHAATGPFAPFEMCAVHDAVKIAASSRAIRISFGEVAGPPRDHAFPRRKRNFILLAYNMIMNFVPKKTLKLFVSEYWWHIAPFISGMKDVEIVFMERSELRNIPIHELIRHRIRFLHPLDVTTQTKIVTAQESASAFSFAWEELTKVLSKQSWFTYKDLQWYAPVERALAYSILVYGARLIADHDALTRIFGKETIQKVLLRAGIGGRQHHFFLAAQLAPRMGIPTIELQHSNEIIDPHTVHSRLATSYLAAYGVRTQEILVRNHGYKAERIRAIGSPRFDRYRDTQTDKVDRNTLCQTFGLSPDKTILFAGIPAEAIDVYFIHFDSYALANFFRELQQLKQAQPNLQMILKCRPGNLRSEYKTYVKELFPDGGIYIAEFEDPFVLMQLSDIILSGDSTLMYEGVLAGRPVILYPLQPHDTYFPTAYANVMPAASSVADLSSHVQRLSTPESRAEAVERAKKFFQVHYSFDGNSSERMKYLLQEELSPLL